MKKIKNYKEFILEEIMALPPTPPAVHTEYQTPQSDISSENTLEVDFGTGDIKPYSNVNELTKLADNLLERIGSLGFERDAYTDALIKDAGVVYLTKGGPANDCNNGIVIQIKVSADGNEYYSFVCYKNGKVVEQSSNWIVSKFQKMNGDKSTYDMFIKKVQESSGKY